jgi:hypothetical protein
LASTCLFFLAKSSRIALLGSLLVSMLQRNCNILCWNVRGLNDVVRQDAVNCEPVDKRHSFHHRMLAGDKTPKFRPKVWSNGQSEQNY